MTASDITKTVSRRDAIRALGVLGTAPLLSCTADNPTAVGGRRRVQPR